MGLEMVRVGAKQKNVYIELNEVGIKTVSYTHLTLPTKA